MLLGGTADQPVVFLRVRKRRVVPMRELNNNKSCDQCSRMKKACPKGKPCSRCMQSGAACTYSRRRPRTPSALVAARRLRGAAAYSLLEQHLKPSLKRCSFSASPATGLVGMQENGFLCDFFGCVGFLPLATQSHIRESMVKIMLTPDHGRQPTTGKGRGDGLQVDGAAGGVEVFNALRGKGLPTEASTCIFWCAVALGALVRGSPIETVASYCELATEALSHHCSGPAEAEVARAWAILAYFHDLMGDGGKYKDCLLRAVSACSSFFKEGPTDIDPVGFPDLINSHHCSPVECAGEQSPPQLTALASGPELYRYVMQSVNAFERAVASKVVQDATDCGILSGAERVGEDTRVPCDPRFQDLRLDPRFAQHLADAMVSLRGKMDFGPLEEIADRSSIGVGVGGMMIAIINTRLYFETASMGDTHGTLKRLSRCVDVFERYPGLCRSAIWCHRVHVELTALARLDVPGSRQAYDRLMAAYNSCRPLGLLPAPPLDEWRGISSICDHVMCSALDAVMASDSMGAFKNPSYGVPSEATDVDEGEKFLGPGGKSKDFFSARKAPEEDNLVSVPFSSEHSKTSSTPSMSSTCQASWGHSSSLAGAGQRMPPAGVATTSTSLTFPPPSCHSGTELSSEHDATGNVGVAVGRDGAGYAAGRVVDSSETSSTIPHGPWEGLVEGAGDQEIGAADWLDVTHALSDEPS